MLPGSGFHVANSIYVRYWLLLLFDREKVIIQIQIEKYILKDILGVPAVEKGNAFF